MLPGRDRPRSAVRRFAIVAALVHGCTFDVEICPRADGDTVALYSFSESSGLRIANSAGAPGLDGSINDNRVGRVAGPCEGALQFPPSSPWPAAGSETTSYAHLPSSPSWKLTGGSIDLWLRLDPVDTPGVRGILSRDADGEDAPGHLTLMRISDDGGDSIAVRLQDGNPAGWDNSFCGASRVSRGVWHLVQLSFGHGLPLQVSVDGEVLASTQQKISGSFVVCGPDKPGGIDGNDQPWTLGALAIQASNGSISPAHAGMGGAIGSLRISRVRRDR